MYPSTPIMASTAISLLKEPGFLVEMADSRVGAGNIPDGSETFCCARKQGGPLPESCLKDSGVTLKRPH